MLEALLTLLEERQSPTKADTSGAFTPGGGTELSTRSTSIVLLILTTTSKGRSF